MPLPWSHELLSRIFEAFNEMEMETNVINNKHFAKFSLKITVKGKENSFSSRKETT